MAVQTDDDEANSPLREPAAPVLELRGLSVSLPGPKAATPVLEDVSLTCMAGRTHAVVGESGSGKTMSFLAAVGHLPAGARVTSGEIIVAGTEITSLSPAQRRKALRQQVSMIFQDSLAGLSPSFTIGQQLVDVIHHGLGVSRRSARRRALEVLDEVRIPEAARRLRQYPHELSGGMRQRVMIAMGIALDPALLVADEPTTALDVTIQEQILELLDQLRQEHGMGLVIITHDLGVVARCADEVTVMYAGRVAEHGSTFDLLDRPRHPYTRALRVAIPRSDKPAGALTTIPGQPARLADHRIGCAFAPRCGQAQGRDLCHEQTPVLQPDPDASGRLAACHFADELADGTDEQTPAGSGDPDGTGPSSGLTEGSVVLELRGLSKSFHRRGRNGHTVHAVVDVDLALHHGEALGLVGESGCGKSTLSRMVLGLVEPSAGTVHIDGVARSAHVSDDATQIVFQDPYASLDPRHRVNRIVAEPLRARRVDRTERDRRVEELLGRVGLDGDMAERYPHQFSGGQRQRIGIARSIAVVPRVLVMDEPVSALDVSMQAQVLNMMQDLRDELGLSILLISHDLSVIRQVTDRVAVMYLGRIVETAPTDQLYAEPLHPYTEALLSASPVPDPTVERSRERVRLVGDIGGGAPETGCALHPRCHRARALGTALPAASVIVDANGAAVPRRCVEVAPTLHAVSDDHSVACHFPAATAEVHIRAADD